METDIEHMRVGGPEWRPSLGFGAGVELNPVLERAKRGLLGRSNLVHLALTPDGLWSFYRTEILFWSFHQIRRVELRLGPRPAEDSEDEDLRRAHLGTEVQVEILGNLCWLAAFLALVNSIRVTWGADSSGWSWESLFGLVLSAGTAIGLASVGWGLFRFRPWARRAAIIGGSATVFMASVGMVAASVLMLIRRMDMRPVILSILPVLAVIASGVIVLLARKGRFLFSAAGRELVARTHSLDPPPVGWDWSLLFYWNPNALRRTLCLTVDRGEESRQLVSYRFRSRKACCSWAGALERGRAALPVGPACMAPEDSSSRAVVLLRGRPRLRYQLLGPVEAKAESRRMARVAIQVRAAMLGADAVIDIQEERIHEYDRTMRRLGGTAVKAVDPEGRFEFRSRW